MQRTAPRAWRTKINSTTWALKPWAVSIWEPMVFFNPGSNVDAPNVITDLRTDGFTIESNRDVTSFDLIASFLPDGENQVYSTPLLETSEEIFADQSILPSDAEITFENGILDVTVNYRGFRFNPDNVNDTFVYDTGPNAIVAVETLSGAGASA